MKKLFHKIKFWYPFWMPWLIVIVLLGFSIWFTYVISNSDMPDWLKWWLLK